jgi:hypothetical protein
VTLVAAGLLAGCGHSADSARAAHEAREQAHNGAERAADAQAAATAEDADMVAAVSGVATVTPVGLKFKLREPPRVGQPLRLELALAQEPGLDIDSILVSLQPGDGLGLESDHSIEIRTPQAGATQRLVVTLRPQQPGLLSLGATVLVDAGSTSLTRNFSIPLIAVPAAQ